jgi:hypothetical protein
VTSLNIAAPVDTGGLNVQDDVVRLKSHEAASGELACSGELAGLRILLTPMKENFKK